MAELLDNAVDEAGSGATFVHVDKVDNPLQGPASPMVQVEDDGGGMDPDALRCAISFG